VALHLVAAWGLFASPVAAAAALLKGLFALLAAALLAVGLQPALLELCCPHQPAQPAACPDASAAVEAEQPPLLLLLLL
jgi:hypothetical protein